jgi:riboflavin kinase/FMN adenylyltransferase
MVIYYGYENLKLVRPVVTLGIFDGVHRGHRALLDYVVLRAKETKGDSVVITLSPHPRLVLTEANEEIAYLTTLEEKIILLGETDINHLVIIEFTSEFSSMSACDFVQNVLVEKLSTNHLIIGYDHHFGRHAEGNYDTIKQCAESLDFKVENIEGISSVSGIISSTAIREALLGGRLEEANNSLGYDYSLKGMIVEGRRLGRSIGFPTANVKPVDEHKLIPCNGVYAVMVQLDGNWMPGVLSIGFNPTVNKRIKSRTIEVHVFDFEKEIYGAEITVAFRYRLRDEARFETIGQLVHQMELDRQQAMRLLS